MLTFLVTLRYAQTELSVYVEAMDEAGAIEAGRVYAAETLLWDRRWTHVFA